MIMLYSRRPEINLSSEKWQQFEIKLLLHIIVKTLCKGQEFFASGCYCFPNMFSGDFDDNVLGKHIGVASKTNRKKTEVCPKTRKWLKVICHTV